jgi:hypothetical protein
LPPATRRRSANWQGYRYSGEEKSRLPDVVRTAKPYRRRAMRLCPADRSHQADPGRQPTARSVADPRCPAAACQAGPRSHARPRSADAAYSRVGAASWQAARRTVGARSPTTHCQGASSARAIAQRPDDTKHHKRAQRRTSAPRLDHTLRAATARPAARPATALDPRAWPGQAPPSQAQPNQAQPNQARPNPACLRPRTRPAGPGSSSRA